jgi:hypothetical protein
MTQDSLTTRPAREVRQVHVLRALVYLTSSVLFLSGVA